MQAQPIPWRFPATKIQHHVLRRPSTRPLRRAASTQASDNTSASAPQDSPCDDSSNERDKYTSDGHATYRKHPSGKRDLPLPPIMDPIALAARERWTEPKMPEPRREDLTPFQRKLYANPAGKHLYEPLSSEPNQNNANLSLPGSTQLTPSPRPSAPTAPRPSSPPSSTSPYTQNLTPPRPHPGSSLSNSPMPRSAHPKRNPNPTTLSRKMHNNRTSHIGASAPPRPPTLPSGRRTSATSAQPTRGACGSKPSTRGRG